MSDERTLIIWRFLSSSVNDCTLNKTSLDNILTIGSFKALKPHKPDFFPIVHINAHN